MRGFHLGGCARSDESVPAGDGCLEHCPRRLHAEIERLQRRCEIYAAGTIAVATYEGEYGLGYETPKRMAQQTLERVESSE